METDILQAKINQEREKLSEETRQSIDAVDWKSVVFGMKNRFNEDQLNNLEINTELLLCGLIDTEDYQKELESSMRIHSTDAMSVINDLDKSVFKKMQENLEKRLNGEIKTISQKPISGWQEKLYEIGAKYKLPIDQIGEIDLNTDKFLAGEISSIQYEKSISNTTSFSKEKIDEIIKDINEKIIIPKRELLKEETGEEKNEKESDFVDIPIPPYMKEDIDEIPLPPAEKSTGKELEMGSEADMYKEHGIEIISDTNPIETPVISKEYLSTPVRDETPSISSDILKENVQGKDSSVNILANKLFEKTASKKTVSDYSLPKINTKIEPISTIQGDAPAKPHDPYHEII